ncbi:MAG TPA: glycerophosphodiester phosphodiesterase family protein, partial [Prevotella sp.]
KYFINMKLKTTVFLASLLFAMNVNGQTKVIAHRGYWDKPGASQNSRASLQNALDLNVYGSETDVWITTDGHIMVNHDPSFGGVNIQTSTYAQCKDLTLSNGEKMPELQEFLQTMKETTSPTKLIIELKKHDKIEDNMRAVHAILKAVDEYGVANKVEYISFSLEACQEFVRCNPKARVAYLEGDVTPAMLFNDGITGIDYQLKVLRKNPHWVAEAHGLNMDVNVWTVNKKADMREMKKLGVDYITTNNPEGAIKVCKE